MKTRIGLNGFGRIGRSIARNVFNSSDVELVVVNDIVEDVENLIYLYNYDTTMGRATYKAQASVEPRGAIVNERLIRIENKHSIREINWRDYKLDVLIDASGVTANVHDAREVVESGSVPKVIVTHSPDSGVDRYVIMGINDDDYDPTTDHILSTTICDANGISHVLKFLDQTWGLESGFVTTLHPWLSYQNLVDGPVAWQASPGHFWTDYSLGRSSIGTVIPKNTTAVTALRSVMPDIEARLEGFSFRIPTQTVCAADLSIRVSTRLTLGELKWQMNRYFNSSPYVSVSEEQLISVDFEQRNESAVIDSRWCNVKADNMVKVVLWYDNEWGYACRVVDLARLVSLR